MARYNEILVGRINRGLQKYFGIKGDAPVPQLAGDVSVAHPLFSGHENRYLEGWSLFGHTDQVAAVAAAQSQIRYRNPAGSNVVVVFHKLYVRFGNADTFVVRYAVTDPGNLANTGTVDQLMDARAGGANTTSMLIRSNQANAAPPLIGQPIFSGSVSAANTPLDIIGTDIQEVPLLPGSALDILDSGVNNTMVVSAWYRQRFLEAEERT